MSDLVEQFYKGELSEAEEEALDQLLASSPEAADRFARIAASAYNRYGLPGAPKGFLGFWGLKIVVALVSAAVFLTAGYHYWHGRHAGALGFSTNQPSLRISFLDAVPTVTKNDSAAALQKTQTAFSYSTLGKETSSSNGFSSSSPVSPSLPSYAITPQSQAAGPGEQTGSSSTGGPQNPVNLSVPRQSSSSSLPLPDSSGSNSAAILGSAANPGSAAAENSRTLAEARLKNKNAYGLKVKVEIIQAGPVTVRVLDKAGLEIKVLYSRSLFPGNYSYIWDGRLTDGRPAIPGKYRIETRSGSSDQFQEFQFGNQVP